MHVKRVIRYLMEPLMEPCWNPPSSAGTPSSGPFQRTLPALEPTLYLQLTWKCEVGAQLGLKRLIWGEVVFFKGFNVKSCGFRGCVGVLECSHRDTNP